MDPIMQQGSMPAPENDDEGKMAKADLYKTARYALKLFKMMDDNAQLEGWVQAKITKAADYMASVYHYMEYEMKFSEYGQKLEMSDMYTAEEKRILKNKLMEAKDKMKELKKAQAAKMKKKTDENAAAPQPKPTNKLYPKGGVTGNVPSPPDGATAPPPKNVKTREGQKLSKKDYDGDGKKETPKDEVWGSRAKAAAKSGKPFEEGKKAKPDYIDLDKDGNKKEPMKKAAKDKKVDEGVKDMEKAVRDKNGPQPKGGSGRKKGKGYDSETNVRKPPEGKVPFTSFHQGKQGDQAARLHATSAKGKLVKGKAQSAPQPKDLDEAKDKCNHTAKGKSCPVHGMKECSGMSEAANAKQQAAIAIAKKKKATA